MLFTLTGGAGAYGNAGQSWSQPVLTDIKVGSDVKKVLVFGGGYDMCYEDGVSCGATTKGNQIYIVDAETGGLIWWAAGAGAPSATPSAVSISDMKYSIPSEVKVLDLNSDGLRIRCISGIWVANCSAWTLTMASQGRPSSSASS